MAKPIELIPTPCDAREELKRRVESAPVEHAAAVLSAYELLDEMHTNGLLDLLRGAAGASGEIAKHAAGMAAEPESIRALRNLLVMGKLLGSIDPEILHRLSESLPASVGQRRDEKPPSLFQIFRKMRSPDSRRALGITANVLEGIGRSLDPKKK